MSKLILPARFVRGKKYSPWLVLYKEAQPEHNKPPEFFCGHSSGITRFLELEKEGYLTIVGHCDTQELAKETARRLNDKIPGKKADREKFLKSLKPKE